LTDDALRQAGAVLSDMDAIAVTHGPGLLGALLVGVTWAKTVAWREPMPLLGVHHLEGHLFAPVIEHPDVQPPFTALLVSGGHTMLLDVAAWGEYRLLGETRDDAAGEAFDKVPKLLGLRYPGGPEIERQATAGDAKRHRLPRPMLARTQRPEDPDYFDFSFSGLKTAVVELTRAVTETCALEVERPHIAAAFQAAAVDVLASKVMRAVEETGCRRVLIGGGVSANGALRRELADRLGARGRLCHSTPRLALDNGAMVARTARFRYDRDEVADGHESASASRPFPGLAPRRA
jgi:N6-L-threonylcarbamoyladenine synthase